MAHVRKGRVGQGADLVVAQISERNIRKTIIHHIDLQSEAEGAARQILTPAVGI